MTPPSLFMLLFVFPVLVYWLAEYAGKVFRRLR